MSTYTVTLYNFTGLPLSISDNDKFKYDLPCEVGGKHFVAPQVKLKAGTVASYSVSSQGYDAAKSGYQIAPFAFTVPTTPGDTGLFLAVDRSAFDAVTPRSGYLSAYDPKDETVLYLKCVKGHIVDGRKIVKNFSVVPYATGPDSKQLLVLPLTPVGVKKGVINTQIKDRIKKINDWMTSEDEDSSSWFVWVILVIIVIIVLVVLVGGSVAAWKYYQSRNM